MALLRSLGTFLLFVSLALFPGSVEARNLDEAVKTIVDTVSKYVVSEGATKEISISVSGPPQSSTQLVEKKLRELFDKQDFQIEDITSWKLEVKLRIPKQPPSTTILSVELLDAGGNTKDDFDELFEEISADPIPPETVEKKIPPATSTRSDVRPQDKNGKGEAKVDANNPSETSKIQGQNVDFTPVVEQVTGESPGKLVPLASNAPDPGKLRDQTAKIQKGISEKISSVSAAPTFIVATSQENGTAKTNSVLRPEQSSKFGLEILRSASSQGPYTPVTVEKRGSQPFVELDEGDFIQISVYNESQFPVGLELMIDGVNSLALHQDKNVQTSGKWLLNSSPKPGLISGWLKTESKMDQFIITSEPNGVAARFGLNHKIGTIQANFYMAWDEEQYRNETAPLFAVLCNNVQAASSDNAFGAGPEIAFAGRITKAVFDRGFSLATITLLHENPQAPRLGLPPGPPANSGN